MMMTSGFGDGGSNVKVGTEADALLERLRAFATPDPPHGDSVIWLQQRGEIRGGPDKAWMRFTATQWYRPAKLAFRWFARVNMSRFVHARVIDGFKDGTGHFEVRLLGIPI